MIGVLLLCSQVGCYWASQTSQDEMKKANELLLFIGFSTKLIAKCIFRLLRLQ